MRYNVLKSCATRSCCACGDEPTCVAERYLTLRTGFERHGRKNPLPFPFFGAVTCRQSAPDPPRERGDSQEGGNRRCLPSCAPARRQRTPPPRGVSARSRAPQSATLRLIRAKNSPPVRGEPADAVRVPRSAGAEKGCRPDSANRFASRVPLEIGTG